MQAGHAHEQRFMRPMRTGWPAPSPPRGSAPAAAAPRARRPRGSWPQGSAPRRRGTRGAALQRRRGGDRGAPLCQTFSHCQTLSCQATACLIRRSPPTAHLRGTCPCSFLLQLHWPLRSAPPPTSLCDGARRAELATRCQRTQPDAGVAQGDGEWPAQCIRQPQVAVTHPCAQVASPDQGLWRCLTVSAGTGALPACPLST